MATIWRGIGLVCTLVLLLSCHARQPGAPRTADAGSRERPRTAVWPLRIVAMMRPQRISPRSWRLTQST